MAAHAHSERVSESATALRLHDPCNKLSSLSRSVRCGWPRELLTDCCGQGYLLFRNQRADTHLLERRPEAWRLSGAGLSRPCSHSVRLASLFTIVLYQDLRPAGRGQDQLSSRVMLPLLRGGVDRSSRLPMSLDRWECVCCLMLDSCWPRLRIR